MKKVVCIFSVYFFSFSKGFSQELDSFGFYQFNKQIEYSLEEYKRQNKLKEQQVVSTGEEAVNESFWKKYKEKYQRVQERLRIVDFALQAIPTAYVLYQKTENIKNIQSRIWIELYLWKRGASIRDMSLLRKVFNDYSRFVKEIEMIGRYLAGLVLSYGAINQMEKAERQTLLNFAMDEMQSIENISVKTLHTIIAYKEQARLRRATWTAIVNKDKQIVEEFMKNMKSL